MILEDVVEHCGGRVVTNDMVAEILRSGHHSTLDDDERILLLEEFLKSGDSNLLHGTNLLPTRGGAFTSLKPHGPNVRPLYVEQQSDFWTTLPQIRDRFLDMDRISIPGVSMIRRLLEEGECKTNIARMYEIHSWLVQLYFAPEMGVLYMMFERCHTKHRKKSLKQHITYLNFRTKIQLDHPVVLS